MICIVINVSYYFKYNFTAHDAGHKYAHVQSLVLHSVYRPRCPDADQILPKLPLSSSSGERSFCLIRALKSPLWLDFGLSNLLLLTYLLMEQSPS